MKVEGMMHEGLDHEGLQHDGLEHEGLRHEGLMFWTTFWAGDWLLDIGDWFLTSIDP